tara:strand:- start:1850 stop:2053 length:204 start_codon:yes stop_codon:yes gene_type:complete
MKNNTKLILIIIIGITFLYLTKGKYSEYSLKKSISACMIAQKQKSSNMTKLEAEKFCKSEIKKKINR